MMKQQTGRCDAPCFEYDLIGNCYVTDTDGGCLCIDLCRRFSARESENVGTDTRGEMYGELKPGTGCEACVRNKNVLWGPAQKAMVPSSKKAGLLGTAMSMGSSIIPPPRPHWVYESNILTEPYMRCGMCDGECVAGGRSGPLLEGEQCGGEWMWSLQDCRRWKLTSEDTEPTEGLDTVAYIPGSKGDSGSSTINGEEGK